MVGACLWSGLAQTTVGNQQVATKMGLSSHKTLYLISASFPAGGSYPGSDLQPVRGQAAGLWAREGAWPLWPAPAPHQHFRYREPTRFTGGPFLNRQRQHSSPDSHPHYLWSRYDSCWQQYPICWTATADSCCSYGSQQSISGADHRIVSVQARCTEWGISGTTRWGTTQLGLPLCGPTPSESAGGCFLRLPGLPGTAARAQCSKPDG